MKIPPVSGVEKCRYDPIASRPQDIVVQFDIVKHIPYPRPINNRLDINAFRTDSIYRDCRRDPEKL